MQTYSEFSPTPFDSAGAFLPDRQDWLVVPVMQTRDSGPLELSNFASALASLGGESRTVEVHRFGHWGPGWFEIIIVNPRSKKRVAIAEDIERALSDYPVLDDEDFSRREWEDYTESWENYGARDFARGLVRAFDLRERAEDILDGCDNDTLREFYESLITSGEYYVGESSGVHLPIDRAIEKCTREELARFLRQCRATVNA